jgi:competence protein ComEC
MAGEKKRIRQLLIALPVAVAFILIANLCGTGLLPAWLQKPLDAINSATGGLLYEQRQSAAGLSVHFIDVGQGDSILVCCEGKNMLIDGGVPDEGAAVENYLRGCGVRSLEYVVGTHPHDDHIGGLVSVIKDYDIGTIIMSGATTTTQTYENLLTSISGKKKSITRAKVGDSYELGGATFVILAPAGTYDDLNETSVVIKLTYSARSFLFTGDASEASEKDMLAENRDLCADVLKVGHHGSSTATSQDFLNAVHPSFAVISVGQGNKYGLPNTEVTQRLKDAGIKIFRTDTEGTIVFKSDGQSITYKKEKNSGKFNETS